MRTQAVGIAVVLGLVSATLAALAQTPTMGVPASAADASAGDASSAADASSATSAPDAEPASTILPDAGAPEASGAAALPVEPPDAAPAPVPVEPPVALADAGASKEPSDVGFQIGIHGGYAIPFGGAKDVSFSDVIGGAIPIGVDFGYFLNRKLYLGVYAVYGFATNSAGANSTCPNDPDISCDANLWRFGATAQYHFIPQSKISPWVGGALGYEIVNITATDNTTGSEALSSSLHGFDISALAGVDYKPRPYFGLGPYMEFSMGHFASDTSSTKLFEWLSFGLRLRTGI